MKLFIKISLLLLLPAFVQAQQLHKELETLTELKFTQKQLIQNK